MNKDGEVIWLGISGLPGSGKTTIAQGIETEFREKGYICAVGKVSDIIRQETRKLGLAVTRPNMYKVGEEARNIKGEGVWAKRFIANYIGQGLDVILVDGIRTLSELKEFRDTFGKKFKLLAIEVETGILVQRIIQRNRIDDEAMRQNPEQIFEKEIALGVVDCMRNADFTLRNNGEESEIAQMTKSLVSQLISLVLQGD